MDVEARLACHIHRHRIPYNAHLLLDRRVAHYLRIQPLFPLLLHDRLLLVLALFTDYQQVASHESSVTSKGGHVTSCRLKPPPLMLSIPR
jgi:hypothetical protein